MNKFRNKNNHHFILTDTEFGVRDLRDSPPLLGSPAAEVVAAEVGVQDSLLQVCSCSVLFLQMSKSGWKKFVLVLVPLPQEAEQELHTDHPICGPQSTKHVTSDQV